MHSAIELFIEVGRDEGQWNVWATNRSNPLEVWGKVFPDGEAARADACDLGLIDRTQELLSGDMAVTYTYRRTAVVEVSPDLLRVNGFERRVVELNYRGIIGNANMIGPFRSQNWTQFPRAGDLIPASETPGLEGSHTVKSIMGPFVIGGRITYTFMLE
jgi:hypothetical protein